MTAGAPPGDRGAGSARIEAERAARFYGDVVACREVTLKIGPGVTALVGPNGAGKSTLLRLLAGALPPSSGAVRVLGRDPFRDTLSRADIGYCPEHDGLYDELAAVDQVSALAAMSGLPPGEARARAAATLDELGLADVKDRPVGAFSRGMRQRVKLALALAHDPEVVLLDEPLTGCDPAARRLVQDLVRDLGAAGRTVLVSSHVLPELEELTARIVLLHHGAVVADGDVHALRALIDEHPHRILVTCERPRAFAALLVTEPSVVRVEIDDSGAVPGESAACGRVGLETRDPDACYPRLPEIAARAGARIVELTSPDDDLASVFRYLTARGGPS